MSLIIRAKKDLPTTMRTRPDMYCTTKYIVVIHTVDPQII